jgi:hypothetical protein
MDLRLSKPDRALFSRQHSRGLVGYACDSLIELSAALLVHQRLRLQASILSSYTRTPFTHMVREDTASESHVPCPADVLAISFLLAGGTHIDMTDTLEIDGETLCQGLQPRYVIPVEGRVVERGSLRDGSHSGSWLGAEPASLELLRGLSIIPDIRVYRKNQCAGAVSTTRTSS